MRTPLAFLRFVAKAGLNVVGFGVAGDFAVEVLPDLARDMWQWWGRGRGEAELKAEVQEVAQLQGDEARRAAEAAVIAEAADRPEEVRRALTAYLVQVPAAVRRSQRRPADPSGRSLMHGLSLCQPADVLPFLPSGLPRFKPGDRPAGIGDWELEELLGMGGFGEVWKARNPHLAEPVALKFCLDAGAALVLRNEAALLGRVMSQGRHPGIVRLLHTYLSADTPCLEYEYVPGGDLAGLIVQWHRAPASSLPDQAMRLMRKLADIVAFAHRLDPPIVHRDLKPANILVQPAGKGEVSLRVADFGIGGVAVHRAREKTRRGATGPATSLAAALRGSCTPLYASPQQMRGDPPDPRDDVHALGVIWYQLLTGDLTSGPPADWRDVLAERGVPEGALQLLGACLASRAEKRPADAVALAEGLAAVLEADAPYAELVDPAPAARPERPARPTKGRPPFWKAQPVPAEEPPEVLPVTDGAPPRRPAVRVPRVDVQDRQLTTDLGPDEVFAALHETFLQWGVQGIMADRLRRTVMGATGLDVRSFGQYVQGQVVTSGRQTVVTVSSTPQRQLFDWGRGDQEARAIIQMLARRLTSPARRRDTV
jgi:serine/threonine protein kinase